MKNLLSILDRELADERAALAATDFDIERAAAFCGENYLNGPTQDKLENTMAVATQSLGTVAFHISKLAEHFLDAMTLQSNILAEIADRMEKLRMVYNIHQEKVARKSIGSCTKSKVPVVFQHGTAHPEPPQRYIRRPIDYCILDSTGHGVRVQEPMATQYGSSIPPDNMSQHNNSMVSNQVVFGKQAGVMTTRSSRNLSEYSVASVHSMGTTRYPSGSVGRTAGIYRTTPHMFNAQFQHPREDGTNSVPVSPLGSYAPGHLGSSAALVAMDTAGTTISQSARSSGSSSVGSNVPMSGHYATNQQLQHMYTVTQGLGKVPQMGHTHAPLVKHANLLGEQNQSAQERPTPHYAPTHHMPLMSDAPQHQNRAVPGPLQEPMASQYHYAQQRPIQSGVMKAAPMTTLPQSAVSLPQTHQTSNAVNVPSAQTPLQTVTYTAASTADAQHALLDNVDHMPLPPPPEAYAEPVPKTCGQSNEPMIIPNGLVARKPEDPCWAPPYYMEKVVTVYEYVRDKDDELTFSENQIIYVVKKNDDGWWEGIMNGTTGLFPGNYVELID